jgi:hypothetical protein
MVFTIEPAFVPVEIEAIEKLMKSPALSDVMIKR